MSGLDSYAQEEVDFRFSVDLRWDQLSRADVGFLEQLSDIVKYLEHEHLSVNIAEISTVLSQLIFQKNHGVLSSLNNSCYAKAAWCSALINCNSLKQDLRVFTF